MHSTPLSVSLKAFVVRWSNTQPENYEVSLNWDLFVHLVVCVEINLCPVHKTHTCTCTRHSLGPKCSLAFMYYNKYLVMIMLTATSLVPRPFWSGGERRAWYTPELEIRIYMCADIMSIHYQFCSDIFIFCSDIVRFCSYMIATRILYTVVQVAADLTNSTPDYQTWWWFDT